MNAQIPVVNAITSPKFFLGGNATFTVSNPEGERYTYRVRRPEEKCPFFLSVLTGPDNENSYTYLGLLQPDGQVVLTKKSQYKTEDRAVRVVRWALKKSFAGQSLPEGYALQHAGKCCCCGKKLTTPESIADGIGPDCGKRFSLAA